MMIGMSIVEDNPAQRHVLRFNIERAFPGVYLEESSTYAEAEQKIESAAGRGVQYAAHVFDINLPRQKDGPAEPQFGLWEKVLESNSGDSHVVYVSSHLDDPDIGTFRHEISRQFEEDKGLRLPHPVFLDKNGEDWVGDVCKTVRPIVSQRISVRIMARIDELLPMLFGQGSPHRSAQSGSFPYRNSSIYEFRFMDPTHVLAQLEGDIEQNWRYLDGQYREEVKSHFVVREIDDDVVEVSLI